MVDKSKKLSLEERLSLAAKKSKKTKKSPSPAAAELTAGEGTIEKGENRDGAEDGKVNEKSENDGKKDKEVVDSAKTSNDQSKDSSKGFVASEEGDIGGTVSEETKDWKRQIHLLNSLKEKEPWSYLLTDNRQFSKIDDFLSIFEPKLESVYEELQNYKKQKDSTSESTNDNEKDELISQLRYEGEKLAGVELRQNNTIKSLRKKLNEMDNDMKVTQEELSKKIFSYEELFHLHEDLECQLRDHEDNIKELRQDNTRLKNSESQLEEKKKEIENLRRTLEVDRSEFEEIEKDFAKQINTLKSSSQEQVTQLEASLEQLRIEFDTRLKQNQEESVRDSEDEKTLRGELKSIKFSSSQLENSLVSKISELESRLKQLQQSNSQLQGQLLSVKQMNDSLENKHVEESKERQENVNRLQELRLENEKLQNTLQDITEDYNLLQRKYEIRHTQWGSNADSDVEAVEKLSKSSQPFGGTDNNKNAIVPPSPMEEEWMYPPNVSQMSSVEHPMDFENDSMQKEVDEISDRPPIEDDNLSMNGMDIPDEAAALGSSGQELRLTSMQTNSMNYHRRSTQVDSTGQMNAHMISKLGAEVRRYEAELVSLQSSCERLQKEKMEASNEILKLLEDNERVQTLAKENNELAKKFQEIQNRLETSLEILGEKTEKVEELENDVTDLKEIMQQQIQQMADMQERIR